MINCESFGEGFLAELNLWAIRHCAPFSTIFELTPFCNFQCVMCYIRLNKEQAEKQGAMLPADEWIKIAEKLRDMGTLNITLTGGEVFTHPDFWNIYEKLNQMGFWISVFTNGYLIDEDVMSKFRLYGMPHMMQITLYGASDDTYYRVCGSRDGFTRVAKAIDLLKEAKVPLSLSATMVKENAGDLQAIHKFAREKKVPVKHTTSVVKSSRGATNSAETSRLGIADFSHEYTLEDLEKSKYRIPEFPFSMCASYRKSLVVTWNGKLQLCPFLSSPSVGYSGDINSDFKKLYSLLEEIKNPEECSDCDWKEFCQRCPGVLCAESGHPEKIDKDFCNIAKQLKQLYDIKKKGIEL